MQLSEIMKPLSEKQSRSILESTARINIWVGAVRSGKTFSSILRFLDIVQSSPPGSEFMVVGYSRAALQRNILGEMCRLVGATAPPSKNDSMKLFGKLVHLVGASDERAVSKIQGSTVLCAYVDEATTLPRVFWDMLLTRLSKKGAKLLATCNPAGPAHWLKKDFIDQSDRLDLKMWHFTLDDNLSLEESYKDALKKEFTGVFYSRYVLGQWTLAHGLVYEALDEDNFYEDLTVNPNFYVAGLDYGTTNPTACVVAGIAPKQYPQISIMDEYYYDGKLHGRSKTDSELADDIKAFLAPYPIRALYVDPAAASMKLELRQRDLPVIDAQNDVLLGIKITSKFIAGKNLVIHRKCTKLREELFGYAWDHKAADRGIDRPVKHADHICVTGDTMVITENGQICIKDLCGSNARCISYDRNESIFEFSDYINVFKTKKNQEIYKLTLKNGMSIRATADHEILTTKGYIKIIDLSCEHEVICL